MHGFLALILTTLVALVPFPTNQKKVLKKGERWDIGCMDIDLTVKETTVKVGDKFVLTNIDVTVVCNSKDKAKAYFTCPANAEADADPPEVLCK